MGEPKVSTRPGSDGNYNAGDTLEAYVSADFNSNRSLTGQLRVVIFSDPEWVDYLRYECAPNVQCYESGWDAPSATYSGRKDLKLCITTPPSWQVPQAGQDYYIHIFSIFYTVRTPATKAFYINAIGSGGPDSCEANPMANGVNDIRGSGACFNNRFPGCSGTQPGFNNGYGDGFSPGFGIKMDGDGEGLTPKDTQQQSTGQDPNPNKNSTGGGGTSAQTQGNEQNQIPTSTSQGTETEQTNAEPSPFYDGKQYAPGSDPIDETLGNISVGGRKIAHGWLYLMAFGIAGSAGGYYMWWNHRKMH